MANLGGDTYTVTPTLIETVGRGSDDQDLDRLIDRHGICKLAAALTYAIPYVEVNMSERVKAREPDLQLAL